MTKEQMTKWAQWGVSMLLGILLSSGAWILKQDKASAVNMTQLEQRLIQLEKARAKDAAQIDLLEDRYTELLRMTSTINAKVDILLAREGVTTTK